MEKALIIRVGDCGRWSDVVVHAGVARWVEVASDSTASPEAQISQVLQQVDQTLAQVGSDRQRLLEVVIYLATFDDLETMNRLWDAWVPAGHAPIRACVQVGLQGNYKIELIVKAAV